MTNNTTRLDSLQPAAEKAVDLFENWFDPIEGAVRDRVRGLIEGPTATMQRARLP